MPKELPDRMTGRDLVIQEEHELNYERRYFDHLDRVDRRDKRNEITSFVATNKYRRGYELIVWNRE